MVKFGTPGGFETLVSIVGAREQSSDYSLTTDIDWSDVASHNVRMAMQGHADQFIWCYEGGKALFPMLHPERMAAFLATRTCTPDFLKTFWPMVDVQQYRYGGMCHFSAAEMTSLFAQLRQAMNAIRFAEESKVAGRIEWLTENPGRQWTGSFQPLPTGMAWYPEEFRRPLQIGIPHAVYCLLRCAQKRRQGVWCFIDHSSLHKIFSWVSRLMVADMHRVLLG